MKTDFTQEKLTDKESIAKGLEYHRQGDYIKAEQYYYQAAQINPGNADVYHLTALVAYARGFPSEAVIRIEQALHLKKSALYYYNLGIVCMDLGQKEKALESFNEALILNPDYNLAQEKRRVILEEKADE